MSDRVILRPGGRSARIQASVHAAVDDLLKEVSRTELTVPMIAARAGVTPSTLYRRWGDLTHLLADVSEQRLHPDQTPPNTGDLRTDLCGWAVQYAEEMSSEVGRGMLRDVLAASAESGSAVRCCLFTAQQIRIICEQAAARGEDHPEIDRVLDIVVAPILFRILFDDRATDGEYCDSLLDRLFRDPRP